MTSITEQLNKIMAMLTGLSNQSSIVNFSRSNENEHIAGIVCLLFINLSPNDWIIDTGSTDHITPHKHILTNVKRLENLWSVTMPNGTSVKVNYIGDCKLSRNI